MVQRPGVLQPCSHSTLAPSQQDHSSGCTNPLDQGTHRTRPWVHSQTHVGQTQTATPEVTGAHAVDSPTVQASTEGSTYNELPRCVLGKVGLEGEQTGRPQLPCGHRALG